MVDGVVVEVVVGPLLVGEGVELEQNRLPIVIHLRVENAIPVLSI
jgi:hypothetical protein